MDIAWGIIMVVVSFFTGVLSGLVLAKIAYHRLVEKKEDGTGAPSG